MTAIQRWMWHHDDRNRQLVHVSVPAHPYDGELWCKSIDVAQLELLLKRYLEDLAKSRQSRDQAKADLAIADAKIQSLEAEIIERNDCARLDTLHMELNYAWTHGSPDAVVDKILNECKDMECSKCARVICPQYDPMHFHHDGCPSCAEDTTRRMEQIKKEFHD